MIRLAFLGVFLLAGLLALGAFFLARGAGGDASSPITVQQGAPEQQPTAPEPTADTLLYFLKDVDLTQGSITLVLRDPITGTGDMVVRDQATIAAAKDTAYINTGPSGGEVAGMVIMAMMGVPPQSSVAQIYRDDQLIATVDCISTTCDDGAPDIDVDFGPLMGAAHPLIHEQSYADNYADYLADLNAIEQSGDYMFLDLRPENAAPQERQTARMELYLPTLVTTAGTNIDSNVTSALARSIVNPVLGDGAVVDGVNFLHMGAGVVVDMDSGTPILAGGAQIPFPDVEFTNLRISISGVATLSDADLEALSEQPLAQTDYTEAFATFVRDRLQSSCDDCFTLKSSGGQYTAATVTLSEPEGYRLDYYDLRDPP